MSRAISQIDWTIDVVTPENIAFHYQAAGPFRRFPAYVIDLIVRAMILVFLVFVFGFLLPSGLQFAIILIALFFLEWFYGGLFETFMNGQTPGKWCLSLRVLTYEGQPINGMQAVMRNFLRAADMMPLATFQVFGGPPAAMFSTCCLGLIVMSMNDRHQRLGDLVAGTMVVVEERRWLTGVARIEDKRAYQLASYLPSDMQVSRSLARTLAMYVERRRFFTAPRRREIAKHLGEVLLHRFGLPADTSHDLLLCAMYYRVFIADRGEDEKYAAQASQAPWEVGGTVQSAGGVQE